MTKVSRTTVIRNAHPRLRLDRRAVARVIHILDEHFPASALVRGRSPEASAKADGATRQPKAWRRLKRRGVLAVPPGELSIAFLTDPALAKIHADFMHDPSATDVITFAGDATAGLAGEICVSADMAARHVGLVEGPAPAGPRPSRSSALPSAFSAELTLYIVHGWLHLAGYDDLQPARKRRMRAAENRAMTLLRKAKAVPTFQLR